MSHFTVLVIGPDHEKQLQPFHEFECTGTNDEFVQDVDITDDVRKSYATQTVTRARAPDGTLHSYFDARGNWKPELSQPVETTETWRKNERTYFTPEGWERVEVPCAEAGVSLHAHIADEHCLKLLPAGAEPDLEGEHKYGYVQLAADGSVDKVIDRTNPRKKWDWWQVGGRWSGFFRLKPNASGELGKPGVMGTRLADGPGRADRARKVDIDFEAMRAAAAQEAGAEWDKVRAITGDLSDYIPWKRMRDEICAGDVSAARTAYHAQRARELLTEASKADYNLHWIELERFTVTREEHVERERRRAAQTFAVLKDGTWFERGDMGWWGMVSDEKDPQEWEREFASLLDSLPDDTVLTVVDCHI